MRGSRCGTGSRVPERRSTGQRRRAGRSSRRKQPHEAALRRPPRGARLPAVPVLVDTTIRLLGQEPLAGRMPTAELLRLAEILDGAGFAYLEVSGGGVFDTAVRRGVESPWERIRALNGRTKTPLAMALRGRFLVGSRLSAVTSSGASSPPRPRAGSRSSGCTTR